MKKYLFAVVSLALVLGAPSVFAQSGALNTAPIENLSSSLIGILNTVVVPVVFAIAFIVFIWGVFQAFILNGANEEKRKEGAKFVLWSVIGFAVMISIWGIVNLFSSVLGNLDNNRPDFPTFDQKSGSSRSSATDPKQHVNETNFPQAPSNTQPKSPGNTQPTQPSPDPEPIFQGNPLQSI